MKRARKLLKWVQGNLRWILAALAALGIIMGGLVERWNYSARMEAQVEALKATVENQEKDIKRLENRKVEMVTEITKVEVFHPMTGVLLRRTRVELAQVKEENKKMLAERSRVPKISLPGQQPQGFYPLGAFITATPEGELGGGIKWRIVPRLSLPLVPDLSLAVGAGLHRDSLVGLVLVDGHRK